MCAATQAIACRNRVATVGHSVVAGEFAIGVCSDFHSFPLPLRHSNSNGSRSLFGFSVDLFDKNDWTKDLIRRRLKAVSTYPFESCTFCAEYFWRCTFRSVFMRDFGIFSKAPTFGKMPGFGSGYAGLGICSYPWRNQREPESCRRAGSAAWNTQNCRSHAHTWNRRQAHLSDGCARAASQFPRGRVGAIRSARGRQMAAGKIRAGNSRREEAASPTPAAGQANSGGGVRQKRRRQSKIRTHFCSCPSASSFLVIGSAVVASVFKQPPDGLG